MLEKKSTKAGKILTFVGIFLLLLSFVLGGELLGLFICVSIVVLIIGICKWASGSSKNKATAKAVESMKSLGIYDEIQTGLTTGSVKEYNKLGLMISSERIILVGKEFHVFEGSALANVYGSNIIGKKYDYNNKVIAMEFADGSYVISAPVSRNATCAEFDEALGRLKGMANIQLQGMEV